MWFCVILSHFAGQAFFVVTTGGMPLLPESPCLLQQFCRLCHFHMALRLPAVPDSWDCGRVGQTCTEYGPTCYVYAKRGFEPCGRCQYYPDHGVAKAVGDLCCSCMHEVLSDCCKCRESLYWWAAEAAKRNEFLQASRSTLLPQAQRPWQLNVAKAPVDIRSCLALTDLPPPAPRPYEAKDTGQQIPREPTTSGWPPATKESASTVGGGLKHPEIRPPPGFGNSSELLHAVPCAARLNTAHTSGHVACPGSSGASAAAIWPSVAVNPGTAFLPVPHYVFFEPGHAEATFHGSLPDEGEVLCHRRVGQWNNPLGTTAYADPGVHPDAGHIQERPGLRVQNASHGRENTFADVLMCLQQIDVRLKSLEVGITKLGLPQGRQHSLPRGIYGC